MDNSNYEKDDGLEYIELDQSESEEPQKYNKIALFLAVCFLVGGIVTGTVFIVQKINSYHAQKQYEQLVQDTTKRKETKEDVTVQVEVLPTETESETEPELSGIDKLKVLGVEIPEKEIDFGQLQEELNADIYAWIYIPDSKIDYPILQHPTDNNYYLEHNLNGSKGYPGCIYTENYNAKDFSDPNTVLYGHNMRNGTMFAGLHKFEDMEYFDSNPYIYIYTPEELFVYEIFAAYQYSNEHILYNWDLKDEAVFREYLDMIFSNRSVTSNFREGVEVITNDKIITLSTCIGTKPNNRYLVQGVLLNDKEN